VFFRKIPGLKSVFRTRGRNGRMIQVRRDPPVQSRPPLRSDHVASRAGARGKFSREWRVTAQPLCVTCSMPDYTHGEVGFSYFWSELLI